MSDMSRESLDLDRRPGAPVSIQWTGSDWHIVISMRADTVIVAGSRLVIRDAPDGTMFAALAASETPDAFGRTRQLLSDRRVPDRPDRRVVPAGGRRARDLRDAVRAPRPSSS